MQLTSLREPTESGYPSCVFGQDGDYDVYMDSEKADDITLEDGRIRKIVLCFTERLHSQTDGPQSKTTYRNKFMQVPGGKSGQLYLGKAPYIAEGLPRKYFMESALEFCYGKLHVENGRATNLTINQGWLEADIYNKKFFKKNFTLMVMLDVDSPRDIFHLKGINVGHFSSEEEFKQNYLEAAKKLNAGLFQPKPTKPFSCSSSSEPSKPWREIFGFPKKAEKQPTDENQNPQKPNLKQKISKFFGGAATPAIKGN